jgi:hypothetical protein
LPAGLAVGLGVFPGQGVGPMHATVAVAEVGLVDVADVLDLEAEGLDR